MKYSIINIRAMILEKNVRTFTARDLSSLLTYSPRKSLYYLEKSVKEGLFIQLKRGLYCLKTDPPPEEEIANQLYQPSYLSFEYALAYYSILPEMVYTVTSATTKPTRKFDVENKSFTYTSIKMSAYTGYGLKIADNRRFFIAEPEKAIVDYLYLVSLGRRQTNDRLNVANLDVRKIKEYTKLFHRPMLLPLVTSVIQKSNQDYA